MTRCKRSLLHDYEQKFESLPDHQITKTVAKGQYFTTLDDAELDNMEGSCREPTLPRDNLIIQSERMDPWKHEDRSSLGGSSQLQSRPFRNRDHDQLTMELMIVKRINKYVTGMTEETQENDTDDIGDSTGKPVAEARLKQISMPMSSSPTVTLPCHLREWIDVKPVKYDESCFEMSKRLSDCFAILQYFEKKTEQSNSESWHQCFIQNLRLLRFGQIRTWQNFVAKRSGPKKRFQYCVCGSILGWYHLMPSSNSRPLWKKTPWSYIARQRIVTERLRRAHLPRWKLPRSALDHSIRIDSRWQRRQERETCRSSEATKPRIAVFKHNWKIHQNTAYWLIWGLLRVGAIILYNTLPAVCIVKVVIKKLGE